MALGKELLRGSVNVVDDIADSGVTFSEAVKKRGSEAVKNLKRKAVEKMSGSGVGGGNGKNSSKNRKTSNHPHSSPKRARGKTSLSDSEVKNTKKKKPVSKKKKPTQKFDYF